MNVDEAKELLSYHSGRNTDVENHKWENGFLTSLRPFKGELNEENFIEIMECMKVLVSEYSKDLLDRELIGDIISIIHYTRMWSEPGGMLERNHLLSDEQTSLLMEWIFIMEDTLFWLLNDCVEEAFF